MQSIFVKSCTGESPTVASDLAEKGDKVTCLDVKEPDSRQAKQAALAIVATVCGYFTKAEHSQTEAVTWSGAVNANWSSV